MHRSRRLSIASAVLICALGAAPTWAAAFRPGDKVEAYSSMTGKWEPATIQAVDGERYFVHASDPKVVNAYWGVTPEQVRAAGTAAAAVTPTARAAQPPGQREPTGTGAPAARAPRRPEGSAEHERRADGLVHLRAIIGAGDEMPLGRWTLSVGGQPVLTGRTHNGDGTSTETHQWAGPEKAGSLSINRDGTWLDVSPSGVRTQGRWTDLGQNRVELAGYDGERWTASTWKGELNLVNGVGEYEYGRRQ